MDPKLGSEISLLADYSMESHSKDHENYVNESKTRRRRAKAMLGKLYHFVPTSNGTLKSIFVIIGFEKIYQ